MPLRSFLFLILFTLLLACKSGSDEIESPQTDPLETSVQWNDFVTFKTGNIPLIIVAPHGGDLKPQWIDDRGCPDSKLLQDQYTLGIALQIEQEPRTLPPSSSQSIVYNPCNSAATASTRSITLNKFPPHIFAISS